MKKLVVTIVVFFVAQGVTAQVEREDKQTKSVEQLNFETLKEIRRIKKDLGKFEPFVFRSRNYEDWQALYKVLRTGLDLVEVSAIQDSVRYVRELEKYKKDEKEE